MCSAILYSRRISCKENTEELVPDSVYPVLDRKLERNEMWRQDEIDYNTFWRKTFNRRVQLKVKQLKSPEPDA